MLVRAGETGRYLVQQVLHGKPVISRYFRYKLSGATFGVQCKGCKAQPGHPSFRTLFHQVDDMLIRRKWSVWRRNAATSSPVKRSTPLRISTNWPRKRKVDRGSGGSARAEGKMERARRAKQQLGQQLMYVLAVDPVVIVQRQDETLPRLQQTTVGQAVDLIGRVWRSRPGAAAIRSPARALASPCRQMEERTNGGNQVGQESSQIAVAFVQRKPRTGPGGIASQSHNKVVLPKPAGAHTSVNGRSRS